MLLNRSCFQQTELKIVVVFFLFFFVFLLLFFLFFFNSLVKKKKKNFKMRLHYSIEEAFNCENREK